MGSVRAVVRVVELVVRRAPPEAHPARSVAATATARSAIGRLLSRRTTQLLRLKLPNPVPIVGHSGALAQTPLRAAAAREDGTRPHELLGLGSQHPPDVGAVRTRREDTASPGVAVAREPGDASIAR